MGNPGFLGYIWILRESMIGWIKEIQEIILPSYIGITVSHSNDHYLPTQYHGMSLVGFVAVAQMHTCISGQNEWQMYNLSNFVRPFLGDTSRILPSRSLTAKAPEKLPKPNNPWEAGSSSKQHHFSELLPLNFGRVTGAFANVQPLKTSNSWPCKSKPQL